MISYRSEIGVEPRPGCSIGGVSGRAVRTTGERDDTATVASARNRSTDWHHNSNRNRATDYDHNSNRDRTSTATRSGTNGIFDRNRTSTETARHGTASPRDSDRDSTAPRPPQPRRGFSAPPTLASLAHVPRARRKWGRITRNSGYISTFERFYTPRRRQARHPIRAILEPRRTRSAGDRNRVVFERQREPTRSSRRQQSGRFGDDCDDRVPSLQTSRWVTTSSDVMGRTFGWD